MGEYQARINITAETKEKRNAMMYLITQYKCTLTALEEENCFSIQYDKCDAKKVKQYLKEHEILF